jgi:KilA-N domain
VTNLGIGSEIIVRSLNQVSIGQRAQDGYIDATATRQAARKRWNDYARNQATAEVLAELSRSAEIPADLLVEPITAGPNEQRGTWVHPDVAIHLAMWCSPAFSVQVVSWVKLWFQTRQQPMVLPVADLIRIKGYAISAAG